MLNISLFGTFDAQYSGCAVIGLEAPRIQELFCYLLLHRSRVVARDILANLLWGDSSTMLSKKYLRQSLWQLQTALEACIPGDMQRLLVSEHDGLQIDSNIPIWLDIEQVERAFTQTKGIAGEQLSQDYVNLLHDAVRLYQGDLLEGWYQDWCVYERERFQNMFLMMLGKLMTYCEAHREFEAAISYGYQILRYDRAHERTHRRLMRLHYLAGDRVTALRQYQRCVTALREELDVEPATQTISLYECLQADRLPEPALFLKQASLEQSPITTALARLEQVSNMLVDLQRVVSDDIQLLRRAVGE